MELGIIVEVFSIGFAFGSELFDFARCFCCHFIHIHPLACFWDVRLLFGARHLFWVASGFRPLFCHHLIIHSRHIYRPSTIHFIYDDAAQHRHRRIGASQSEKLGNTKTHGEGAPDKESAQLTLK